MKNLSLHKLFLFSFICAVTCSRCFASNSSDYPWYFHVNNVEESWGIAKEKGANVVANVVDSKIEFISILCGRNRIYLQDKDDVAGSSIQCYSTAPGIKPGSDLHGTAIASLIAGEPFRLTCESVSKKYLCDKDGRIAVAGIAPETKIRDRAWYPNGSLRDILSECISEKVDIDPNDNLPGRKASYKTHLLLINVSGGQKDGDIANLIKKKASTNKNGSGNESFLIIAGVGNVGAKLVKQNVGSKKCPLPACIPREDFEKNGIKDPIIRVGGTSKYTAKVDGYDIYLIQISSTDNLPELTKRTADKLPLLVKKVNDVYVYGKSLAGSFGYTQLNANNFTNVAFPDIGQSEIKIDKNQVSKNIYEQLKVGHIQLKPELANLSNSSWHSNYGENLVDILAPGTNIPVLTRDGEAMVVNGTSDATAIVSGIAALLSSCKPSADANDIRQAILDNSTKYPDNLGREVKDGRVADVYNTVKNYCQPKMPIA